MTAILWRPAAPDRFTPGRSVPVDTIVFHTTTTSWQQAIDTFQGGSRLVSAHYVVDRDVDQIARCVNETDTAWHAGNWPVNQRSVGIERADFGDYWNPGPDAQLERIVTLALDIMTRHPITRFLRHDQCTATACPDGLDTARIIREVQMPAFDYGSIEEKVKATVRAVMLGEPAITATALKAFLTASKAAPAPKRRTATSVAKVRAGHGRGKG